MIHFRRRETSLLMRQYEELTPTPVAVESPIQNPEAGRISKTRSGLRALLFPAALAGTLVMPGMIDAARDAHVDGQRAAIARVAEAQKPMPTQLQMIQHSVASKMFGSDEKGVRQAEILARKLAVKLNEHDFDQPGAWRLNVEDFVSSDIPMSDDLREFYVQNTGISLSRGADTVGNAYIMGGQTMEKDGKIQLVNPSLIGAAQKAEGLTDEQVRELAEADARERLERFLRAELALNEYAVK